MKLSVIIVSYNVKHYLRQCLDSLIPALNDIESEIFVVDNASIDGSVISLRRRYKNVTYIECLENTGYAHANNVAITQATGEYVLLLNPDTFVAENTIREVLNFMDAHLRVGGAGVKMHNSDGSVAKESRRGIPTPMTSFFKLCGLCSRFPRNRKFGKYYMGWLDWDKPQRIEIISGAFCMLRREALNQIGLLDEDFFMYGEDVDLSYRLLIGGWENWYLPFDILHYKGESTRKTSLNYVHVFYRAMLIFLKKHYRRLGILLSLPIKIAIYALASGAIISASAKRLSESSGFINRLPKKIFIFIGKRRMTAQCERIGKHRGLTFITQDTVDTTIDIASILEKEKKSDVCLVFDTSTFSYAEIIKVMSIYTGKNIYVGTYDKHTRTIITPHEIIF